MRRLDDVAEALAPVRVEAATAVSLVSAFAVSVADFRVREACRVRELLVLDGVAVDAVASDGAALGLAAAVDFAAGCVARWVARFFFFFAAAGLTGVVLAHSVETVSKIEIAKVKSRKNEIERQDFFICQLTAGRPELG